MPAAAGKRQQAPSRKFRDAPTLVSDQAVFLRWQRCFAAEHVFSEFARSSTLPDASFKELCLWFKLQHDEYRNEGLPVIVLVWPEARKSLTLKDNLGHALKV